jgi:hypothetical protein
MKFVTRWAMAGALLILAMPMAADAHPWNHYGAHNGWRAIARANMAANPNLAASQYLAQSQYGAGANWAAMRAQQAMMRQAYLNNLREQQWALRNSYGAAATPYMGYAPASSYMASPYGASPYGASAYGGSPLSSLMAPIMSSFMPTAASSCTPVGQPNYYGAGAGYGRYGAPSYGGYLPASAYGGQIPGRNMAYLPWAHHHLFNTGSTTAPIASTAPVTHTGSIGRAVGALPGNFIR